ncbi:Phosphatidylinositol N-acetylglucosaminyltransferase subunit Q [Taenia crassiceps]|uniref:Phosphatidylinositol N-acetylglucosaminyltransferase subunit Q n=1 Tax=Taenia crassiceps TaxID=6207 RepID=A0ABR4Q421_9CEST
MDQPGVFRHHVWGRRLVGDDACSFNQLILLVLAHSPVAKVGQTNCTGVPVLLPGIEKAIQGNISCLMPGCRHATVSPLEAKSLNWPFCSTDDSSDSPFYPSTKSAAFAALWITFDARSLLSGLHSITSNNITTLRDRFGDLPFLLVQNLSLQSPVSPPPHPHHSTKPPDAIPPHTPSKSGLWNSIKPWLIKAVNKSYTLHLLSRHFTSRKTALPTLLILPFALQLILCLLLALVFYLPTFSPSSQRLCHIYSQSMDQLTLLSQSLRAKNISNFNGSCLILHHLNRNPQICCAEEGPNQQTPTDVLNSFTVVALGSLRHGCVFELVASSTDYFASELNRLLIWLGSSEPAGWKINRNLALLMSRFFISHVAAWRIYVRFIIHISSSAFHWVYYVFFVTFHVEKFHLVVLLLSEAFLGVYLSSSSWRHNLVDLFSSSIRLAAALVICFCLDFLVLATLHLACFYVYTVRLFRFQLLAVAASWRLCRSGSKWNPLRGRVDTIPQNDDIPPVVPSAVLVLEGTEGEEESVETAPMPSGQLRHLDRVFVATFLGVATGLCLLPTTVAFYAVFSIIYIALVCVKALLTRIVCGILAFPLGTVVAWSLDSWSTRTSLVIKSPILDSVRVPFLSMELVRGSLRDSVKRNSLFDTKDLFGKRYSAGKVLKSLVCANLLYPVSEN